MPTEAEWEYSARGPDELIYPWGNELVSGNAVYGQTSSGGLATVGSKPGGVSWVGLFDLAGNAAEIVNDWYGEAYYAELGDAENPQGPGFAERSPERGGSWYSGSYRLRSSMRLTGDSRYTLGFRCARDWTTED